ncbi:MAG: AAA domain-containing protein [Candidatus Aminicenantes bacterium]|nr:AAA domain-containing protein [Candidatus Aminicenantes bacterium]
MTGAGETHRQDAQAVSPYYQIIGKSLAVQRVFRFIHKVKNIHAPVFISGESGTGKELVARNIHSTGSKRKQNFVAINCGAIPENLLESELFGYKKGSFTGAFRDKLGLIEEAHGGVLFLDEICDLSPLLQSKLLRVLQEKEIRRIGENRPHPIDIRVISATNKDIDQELEKGQFREDLYYRLKILSIELPPLKERGCDILYLVEYFSSQFKKEMGLKNLTFSPDAMNCLLSYSWPGNVRELKNEVLRCMVLCQDSDVISKEKLSQRICMSAQRASPISYDFFAARAHFEKRYLNQALARFNYNQTQTAEQIGLSRQGLFKLIKKHQIEMP